MRKIRVRDLVEWPPEMGGAFAAGRMRRVDPGDAIVSRFVRRSGPKITFACIFKGTSYVYYYDAKTENIAEQLEIIVKNNTGKSLSTLGELEIQAE